MPAQRHWDVLPMCPCADPLLQYGCDRKNTPAMTNHGLAKGLQSLQIMLDFFNITNELIVQQHVHSKVAYLPMEGACQDPVFNTWHVLFMRDVVLRHLAQQPMAAAAPKDFASHIPGSKKKHMVVLRRSSYSKFTRNGADLVRQWDESFQTKLLTMLSEWFGADYAIHLLSDQDERYMNCFACQAQLLSTATVLVGMHGAGLGLMLYMPPQSAVVEIAPYGNDGRCLLGGGPFSRLAAVMAHNYMIHYPPYEELVWKTARASKSAEFNLTRLGVHMRSFLTAIRFIDS